MRLIFLTLIGSFVLVSYVFTPAQASLIDNGSFTTDTMTGLDWLDVTETQGLSFDEILNDAGGFFSTGWRYATSSELDELFIRIVGTPEGETHPSSSFGDTLNLVGLFGATLGFNISGAAITIVKTDGFPVQLVTMGWFDDGTGGSNAGMAEVIARFEDQFVTSAVRWVTLDDFLPASQNVPQAGSFLVRSSSVVSVPEPSSLLLVTSAMFPLVAFSRYRRLKHRWGKHY